MRHLLVTAAVRPSKKFSLQVQSSVYCRKLAVTAATVDMATAVQLCLACTSADKVGMYGRSYNGPRVRENTFHISDTDNFITKFLQR